MSDQPNILDLAEVRRFVNKWAIDCGGVVARRREALGLDRRQLAELVGTTEATIHRVESGAIVPRDYLKLAIAQALAQDAEELWALPNRARVAAEAAA